MADTDIQVWVIEDDVTYQETLRRLIDRSEGLRCGLSVPSCEEAIAELEKGRRPDVILLDLELAGMRGEEGAEHMRMLVPDAAIVVLSVYQDDDRIFEALRRGANGYLLKPSSGENIVRAIESASRGGAPINPVIAERILDMFKSSFTRSADYGLTDREREILNLLTEGRTKSSIADELFISYHTVDMHVRHIYAKLQVNSRGGAIAKAIRENLL